MLGSPQVRAEGLRAAIENALDDAGLTPADIDAVAPHACGGRESDAEELAALRAVFGSRLASIEIITVAPNIGDCVAGSAGLSACVAAVALREQRIPARLNSGRPPEDLRAGPAPSRSWPGRRVLVCTNALGGQNAALILSTL